MTNTKNILIWTGGALIVVMAILMVIKLAAPSVSSDHEKKVLGKISGGVTSADQVRGNRESKVVLIEYSDYACPACAANEVIISRLVSEYRDQVAFVYRHYPLPYHLHSREAAYAAEAASRQGKFWDLSDVLFAKQGEWAESTDFSVLLSDYVRMIGLDETKLKADMREPTIRAKVENDIKIADEAGLNHTPSYYLNGIEIDNPVSYEEFKKVLDGVLSASS